MKRTIITGLMVFLITLTIRAQKADLLKDKWIYKDIGDKEKLDSTNLKHAIKFYSKSEMEFLTDGKYSFNPLGDNQYTFYKGTWTLNNEETKLTVLLTHPSTGEKKTSEWDIIGLTAKELRLNIGKVVVVFSRLRIEKDISDSGPSITNKKSGIDTIAKKTPPATAKANSDKKAEVKKTTPVNKPVAVKEKPAEVKKEKYPEFFVNKVGDFTIFEAGKKFGVKGSMLNNVYYLEAKYDTVVGLRLEEDHKYKTVFVVIDKNGLQVFNPDKSSFISTTEKLTEYMYSDEYLWVKTDKDRWNLYTETISSNSGYAKVQLLYNSFIIFTAPEKIKVAAWDKIHGYFGEDYYIPEGAEVSHFGGPGDFIYKLKNKVGYTNAKTLLYLPPLFDDIKMGMGTEIQLKYGGEIYSTTFDNIRIPNYSSSYIIKAQTYGKSCGRSDCRNGIIGMSTQTTGGKVEKRQYEKLTINGRILVTSTYVTPVKTTTTAIQCPDRIHDTKRYILEVDKDGVLVRAL